MPRRVQMLRETLSALEDQLDAARELDPETRSQIRSAMGEIQAALDASGAQDGTPELSASLRERFTDAVQHFKGSHPTLTSAIGRVIDALSDLGI